MTRDDAIERRPWRPDRRTFLIGATAAVAAGCSSDDGADDDAGSTATSDSTAATTDADQPTTDEPADTSPVADADAGDADPEVDHAAADDTVVTPMSPAMFASLAVCTLSASSAEGPFPNIERLDRSDISEGYPGHPLRLGIRVVDERCDPVPDATVRIWHADASGDYSAYVDDGGGKDEGEGSNFCRGFQVSDADGIVEFHTIYPGWYTGRAVHIHLQVLVDGDEALTTQLYFDEGVTQEVHSTGEYARFGLPDTTWATDGLIGSPNSDGTGLTLTAGPTMAGTGTLGLINVGVRTA